MIKKSYLTLVIVIAFFAIDRHTVWAATLSFTELPGVWEMFLPPPAPTPMPTFDPSWDIQFDPSWDIQFDPSWDIPLPTPTPTPTPTSTPQPTPTSTPQPVSTPTPIPMPIPAPTPTPAPVTHVHPRGINDISGHWAESAIIYAFDRGMVNLNSNGDARPNQNITRGEFAFAFDNWIKANYATLQRMGFVNADRLSVVGVPDNHPYKSNIDSLAGMGLIGGNSQFMPDEPVQRQEASRILLNLFVLLPDSSFDATYFARLDPSTILSAYSDQSSISSWAHQSVALMTDRGFMGSDNGRFRPADQLTRAEAYALFSNISHGLR